MTAPRVTDALLEATALGEDDLETLAPLLVHAGDELRGILEVGIHEHRRGALAMVEPGAQRRLVAEVAAQADDLHARVVLGEVVEDRGGGVSAAVVNEQDLGGTRELIEHRPEAFQAMSLAPEHQFTGSSRTVAFRNHTGKTVRAKVRTLSTIPDNPATPVELFILDQANNPEAGSNTTAPITIWDITAAKSIGIRYGYAVFEVSVEVL